MYICRLTTCKYLHTFGDLQNRHSTWFLMNEEINMSLFFCILLHSNISIVVHVSLFNGIHFQAFNDLREKCADLFI